MSVPSSMVHRSGDALIVRSVVSGDPIYASEEELDAEVKTLPECKIKRNYSCAACEYFTQNPRHYLYHLRDVHNEKVKIYECPSCLYASKHFQKLLRHTKMVHGSTEGVETPESAARKGRKREEAEEEEEDEEEEELGNESDTEETTFKCELCPYVTKNKAQLGKHEREEHAKTKYFKCTKCTYGTNIKARFTKHTKYHSMPMIKCEMCDFRTPYKWNLDRHCKNHNGTGSFKCGACNFTADIKQSLTVHEMNHHVPPVGQAAGLGVGRRRNKVGASDSALAEETAMQQLQQVARNNATELTTSSDPEESCTATSTAANNNNNNNITNNNNSKKPLSRKFPPSKKSKTDHSTGNRAFSSDFIDPDDIIHHANGNIYIKNKCNLCNYKSAWSGEMAKHEEKVHNIVRSNGGIAPAAKTAKKTVRPIPNLIPIPSQAALALKNPSRYYSPVVMMTAPPPAVSEPMYSQKDLNDICAKSANSELKDLASLFGSEDMFKKPDKGEIASKIPDLLPAMGKQKDSASFFDKFKAKLTTNKLTCELCGHKSKCLTESAAHQKICGNKETTHVQYSAAAHTVSSTRCQYCRQRCKSSTDLLNHMQTCGEALRYRESDNQVTINSKEDEQEYPHPMENRVFVWNNIEVPLDIEMENTADESQYEYVDEASGKQDDNISLDLSIRTHSPSSESSFVINHETPLQNSSTPTVSEKIPTHGNDISIAQHKRVFKCPHCTFWASTASRFHVHIVGHLNRKPFECSLCSYRSNWRWDITKHIKLKSVRDPNHETAKVLMTDETGRRNYTKYNKYLTEINVGGDYNETCGGFGTRSSKNHDQQSPGQVASPGKTELPKLTRAPSSSDFRPLLKNQRPPPGLKAADEVFAKMAHEKKRNGADSKKTMWKCKKCNFRDASRDKLLAHVRDHYQPRAASEATASSAANQEIDERHCRLKHSGDIRVVIGSNRSASDRMEVDDQIEEQDHVDVPQTGTFKCKQCPFSNNDNALFEQHLEGHSIVPDRTERCNVCFYGASHRGELVEHMKLHGIPDPEDFLAGKRVEAKGGDSGDISKRYKCTECPYVTNSKSQYTNHKQFHKPHGGEYACATCGYNVSKRHLLHQHMKVHGINVAAQKHANDYSGEDASDEIEEVGSATGDLQGFSEIPLVWVSKNDKICKMYKCRFCPHVNLRKINIQEHEKMHGNRDRLPHHTFRINETEHKCPDCNYVCNNAGVLSSHSKVHQGLYGKIHGLVDVSRTDEEQIREYSQSAAFYQPMEGIIFDEDDEEDELTDGSDALLRFCNQCPARFLKENEFDIHLRFHHARLIYKCDYCTYTGRQKSDILAHKNVHTYKYQERTRILKEMHDLHRDYPQQAVRAISEDENGLIYVVAENENAEPEISTPPTKIPKAFTVPLSGTELFHQRNQAQQQQTQMEVDSPAGHASATNATPPSIEEEEMPFSSMTQGNPDFIYPTCIKNGRMKEKRYKCHKCPSAFEKRDQYKNHLTLHGANQKYKCEHCDYSVKYYANYTQHMKKHKNSSEALAARKLPTEYEDEEPLKQEDQEEESEDTEDKKVMHRCSICPYSNHRRDALDSHQKRHKSISGSSNAYTCEHCDYSVPQLHFLRDHCKLHFGQNKMAQPEGYMICDSIKLTSRRVDGKSPEDDAKTDENVIFEDRGRDEENRFDPPLRGEFLRQVNSAPAQKVIVNPETGEPHRKLKAASTSSYLSGIDLSIVNNNVREENVDSQTSSDN